MNTTLDPVVIDRSRNTEGPTIVGLHQMAATRSDMPSRKEIVEAFADYVMFNPASILYDLLVALRRRGVNDSIVESVLAHLEMAAD